MCTSSEAHSTLLGMPGGQSSQVRGLAFAVSPADWYRRKLRFPFYFEQTNYRFDVRITRVGPDDRSDPWPDSQIRFAVRFENGNVTLRPIPVPALDIGETTVVHMPPIYVAHPGQTTIAILLNPRADDEFVGLYSYKVRTEESLWVSAGVGVFGVVSILASIFVPICAARMDEPPVVNNNNIIQVQTPVSLTPLPLPAASPQPQQMP